MIDHQCPTQIDSLNSTLQFRHQTPQHTIFHTPIILFAPDETHTGEIRNLMAPSGSGVETL